MPLATFGAQPFCVCAAINNAPIQRATRCGTGSTRGAVEPFAHQAQLIPLR